MWRQKRSRPKERHLRNRPLGRRFVLTAKPAGDNVGKFDRVPPGILKSLATSALSEKF
jgi:hypothetical protein